ncbi:MAG: hypothetical protein AMJ79_12770 [Phycisphaerae bacterium SM23_30]|nr:MAG: hypothetical protein AMJ79_12770 [Phycisphaerae bacterium SM23_30]
MSEVLAKLDQLVLKQKKVRAEAELTLYKVQNSKAFRVMKCPGCGGRALSNDPDEPFVCECGWRSDKANGDAR